jgi:hypothetical protein
MTLAASRANATPQIPAGSFAAANEPPLRLHTRLAGSA